jgi:hypothetical protein
MQNGIQRLQVTRQPIKPSDLSASPEKDRPKKTDKVVPDSFEEWLASPTQTISVGPEPEQGIFFTGLINESSAQIIDKRPKRPRKRRIAG